jgi:hypothetical protein
MRITLLGALIGVGSAFAIVVGAGLQFDRTLRSYPDALVAGVAVTLLVLISFTVTIAVSRLHFKWMGDKVPPAWNPRPLVDFNAWDDDRSRASSGTISDERGAQILPVQEAMTTAKRLRAAALATDPDPARRKYAALIERGEQWNDDQIAYRENASATGTCVHLREVEQAIRRAGIETRLMAAFRMPNLVTLPRIQADCRLNERELRQRFALSDDVQYRDGFQPERAAEDNPWASLTCRECSSSIELVHPSDGRRNSRWFPSAP